MSAIAGSRKRRSTFRSREGVGVASDSMWLFEETLRDGGRPKHGLFSDHEGTKPRETTYLVLARRREGVAWARWQGIMQARPNEEDRLRAMRDSRAGRFLNHP